MNKPTLHLLMGLPGSGKTTLGKLLEKETGATYLSSDEYRLMLFKKPCFQSVQDFSSVRKRLTNLRMR